MITNYEYEDKTTCMKDGFRINEKEFPKRKDKIRWKDIGKKNCPQRKKEKRSDKKKKEKTSQRKKKEGQ